MQYSGIVILEYTIERAHENNFEDAADIGSSFEVSLKVHATILANISGTNDEDYDDENQTNTSSLRPAPAGAGLRGLFKAQLKARNEKVRGVFGL